MKAILCPQCKKELTKGDYDPRLKWWLGPLFGPLLRPLICSEHGRIEIDDLLPEERRSANRRKWMGIIFGGLLNILIIALMIYLACQGITSA